MAFMGKPSIAKDSESLDEKRSKTQLACIQNPTKGYLCISLHDTANGWRLPW
jgi:hypothetical protein